MQNYPGERNCVFTGMVAFTIPMHFLEKRPEGVLVFDLCFPVYVAAAAEFFAVPDQEGGGEGPHLTALLRNLVSPRVLARSPCLEMSLLTKCVPWRVGGIVPEFSSEIFGAELQSREKGGHGKGQLTIHCSLWALTTESSGEAGSLSSVGSHFSATRSRCRSQKGN